ncbi:MAG: sulfite exporter TauE/SafE family protein [Vulcanimicrobiaceae bacterium]
MVRYQDVLYGLAVGLVLGLTGSGGSIVTLPVLVYLVGEAVHPAIATSLAIVGAIATQGTIARREIVRWRTGALLGAAGLLGAVPGALLSRLVPGNVLLLLFAGTMLVSAAAMVRSRTSPGERERPPRPGVVIAAGLGLGFLSGFLGVGGGFAIVPVLVVVLGLSIRDAVATSLFTIALNSLSGLATHAFDGSIDWPVVELFVIGGIPGNVAGLALGERLEQRALKRIFAAVVFGVGLFTGANASGVLRFHGATSSAAVTSPAAATSLPQGRRR